MRFQILLLVLLRVAPAWAECGKNPEQASRIDRLFKDRKWAEVVQLSASTCRTAALNFDYGMALAHLGRLPEARAALVAGQHQLPSQERFDVELAGVAFERKRYPEAASWLRHALKLEPTDEYANNFAGTVYFLVGNLDAALKFWNRVQKPYLQSLQFDPQLKVSRQLLDRAFVFSPAAVLQEDELIATRQRLDGLDIFNPYNIVLAAKKDGSFVAEFHARERNGFGSGPAQALVSTFAGVVYETVYPSYFNMGGRAANLQSLLRWDAQKRRAWVSFSAPIHVLPEFRLNLATDERNENWVIRRSFTGPSPPLASVKLEREVFDASMTKFARPRLDWSIGAELSNRNFRNIDLGSALTPALVESGFELKQQSSIDYKLLHVPEQRFTLTTSATSQFARLWSPTPHIFEKMQASATAHWFPESVGAVYEFEQRVRAGGIAGTAPFDELFMLGVERDNDLWLRGHIGTRDGQKGSSPLGDKFLLTNTDFYRRIYSNGLLTIKAGPQLDMGRMGAPTSGLSSGQWLVDGGAEVKLTVLGTNVVFTYGRDLRAGKNAFFGTAQ